MAQAQTEHNLDPVGLTAEFRPRLASNPARASPREQLGEGGTHEAGE